MIMGARQIRWLAIIAVALALAGLIAWLAAPRPVEASFAAVTPGPIDETVSDQGFARVREAYVVAAPTSGRLHRIDLDVGDPVAAGVTLLARIDPAAAEMLDPRAQAQVAANVTASQAAVAAAVAQKDRLEAEAQRAQAALRRSTTLAAQGILSPQALENAQAAARSANAAARAAAAEVAARRADLVRARAALIGPEREDNRPMAILAPVSGYVTRVLQESARPVTVGTPLVEIGDRHGLEAAIEFLSQDAVRLREGMPAEVFDWGGAAPLSAVVRRVEPQGFTKVSALGVEEQRVLVLLQFQGQSGAESGLGPGYRVWGRVFLRREPSALKVPLGALVRSGGGWAVFCVRDRRARLVPVDVGAMTDREAEIRKGLKAGETVIVFPSDRVRDGVRVRRRDG
jgi:HlyD family secretion protein